MEYKQTTFEEIIESEEKMLLEAGKNYWKFFLYASESNDLLNHFIKSVNDIKKHIALDFFSQIKKHHMLALFSSVRRHHIQTDMNLRQVLEAWTRMAYAMWNEEKEKFYEIKENWTIQVPKRLKEASFNWIQKEFPAWSESIKRLKEQINWSTAHSSIIYASQNSKTDIENGVFNFSFFDSYDELKIKSDLWHIWNIARWLMDLFYGINQKYKVFEFIDDFLPKIQKLEQVNNELKNGLMNTERMKKHISNTQ